LKWAHAFVLAGPGRVFQQCLPKIAGLVVFAGFMTGCIFMPEAQTHGTGTPRLARLTLEVRINEAGSGSGSLGKRAATLNRLVVVMTSGKLTIRDTITSEGSRLSREPAILLDDPTAQQTLLLRYELKPDRPWHIEARVTDALDSVRYLGVLDVDDMDAFEYVDGCLPVEPRYAVWEARFRLPGSVGSGPAQKAVYFSRLAISMNGEKDSDRLPTANSPDQVALRTATADPAKLFGAGSMRFFQTDADAGGVPISVSYDYVGSYTQFFKLRAYGYIEGDTVGRTPERLLYEGERDVNIFTAKGSVDEPVEMGWIATDVLRPENETAIGVRLGRAGRVVMQVYVPGAVALRVGPSPSATLATAPPN
jgi:hypothetical protein